ncbi:MAG: hypothetical protein NC924_03220 [Candidatus Omnitrophica bacterium]|nr:hypothetical protein [Candidatus Omnitrophota bacterium]
MRIKKNPAGWWCTVFILCIAAVLHFYAYRAYIARVDTPWPRKTDRLPSAEDIGTETARRIGTHLSEHRRNDFVNVPGQKKSGALRIGCFGDSYTYGAEVAEGCDYPFFLEKKLRQQGNDIEVINFGIKGGGFHQAFILWDEIGRKYDLDCIVIGPVMLDWREERDLTFHPVFSRNIYYYHARYVLRDGNLQRIDVLGRTNRERFQQYYSFFPPWRYLRYDLNPPRFLECLLPPNRELRNPFYYRLSDYMEEGAVINSQLLANMAASGVKLIVTKSDIAAALDYWKIGAGKIYDLLEYSYPARFPYLTLQNHFSSMGNEVVAAVAAYYMQGNAAAEIPLLFFHGQGINVPGRIPGQAPCNLAQFVSATVYIDNVEVGCFVDIKNEFLMRRYNEISKQEYPPQRMVQQLFQSYARDFYQGSILSLLAWPAGHGKSPMLDAVYLALDFEIREGMPVHIRSRRGRRFQEVFIGSIHCFDSSLTMGMVRTKFGLKSCNGNLLEISSEKIREAFFLKDGMDVSVAIDGREVLSGKVGSNGSLHLYPVKLPLKRLRVRGDISLSVDQFADSGNVWFVGVDARNRVIKLPLAAYIKKRERYPFKTPLREPALRGLATGEKKSSLVADTSSVRVGKDAVR